MTINKLILLTLILTAKFINVDAYTIFCAKDKNGHVWTGNNEDQLFNFRSYVNVIASTDTTLGYVCFTNSSKSNEFIQGGINEAGLFYDGNAVPYSEYKEFNKKKAFPGSERSMMEYILRKCKSVQDVLEIFKIYRLPGTETSQMHFADKNGGFAIVNADSMWITNANYQISTNYNVCHVNKDNINCWRFPITESLLNSREINYETFKIICDSTSQRESSGTIYSNIHDLTTGEIWLFYGMDYEHPYKTNLKEFLSKGTHSFYMRELFSSTPLVSTYNNYLSEGAKTGLAKLESYNLPTNKKKVILRQMSNDLIVFNHDFKSYQFLSTLVSLSGNTDTMLSVFNAFALFCLEKHVEAKIILENVLNGSPNDPLFNNMLKQMNGLFNKKSNSKFELKGFVDAKSVYVEGLNDPSIEYFLIKKGDKWLGKFNLPPDEYHYYFLVDGIVVADPTNSNKIIEDGKTYSKLVIKN